MSNSFSSGVKWAWWPVRPCFHESAVNTFQLNQFKKRVISLYPGRSEIREVSAVAGWTLNSLRNAVRLPVKEHEDSSNNRLLSYARYHQVTFRAKLLNYVQR